MMGGVWVAGCLPGEVAEMCFYRRDQPASSPHAKGLLKAPGRTGPGRAGKAAPWACSRRNLPFLTLLSRLTLFLSLSQGH